ncbi:hypothetical protein KL911_001120 [Ogataea haglerorum]|uniref:uncharacterized protein n=1 Tax=Ogataea haglerorum TaxID=1937702 RepID=UPI001C8A70D1|nr:uncharacterized protein KL911_001120 [Ogataea haglerorum]KAG7758144.1 hypothetical protein KL911_001120 [Ogataea haglerorum]
MTGFKRPLQRRGCSHDVGALDLREIGVDLGDGKRLEGVDEPAPSAGDRERFLHGSGGRVRVEVEVSSSGVDVDFLCAEVQDKGPLPDHVEDVERNQHGHRQVGLEEVGRVRRAAHWEQRDPELCDQNEHVEKNTKVRADDTGLGREHELVGASASDGESSSESDVAEADGSPREHGRQSRKSEQPVEDFSFLRRGGQETEQSERQGEAHGNERSSLSVDVAKDLWSKVLLGERGNCSGAGVDGGVSDGEHGHHDDHVENGRQHLDSSVFDGNDERRGGGVHRGRAEQSVVGVWHEQADDGERDHVEERDSPEHLFDGRRQRLPRVVGFCSSQSAKLGSGERERSGDEDGTQTLETVCKWAWVVEVLASDVATFWTASAVEDDTEDDEADHGDDLDEGEHKLGLTVAPDSEEVDEHNHHVEDGHPRSRVDTRVPEFDCQRGSHQLQREHHEPLQSVVVRHAETPAGRDESGVELDKRTGDRERDGQLTHGLHSKVDHETDESPRNDERGRASGREGASGTDKQTCSDRTSQSNHLDVSWLEVSLQRRTSTEDVGTLDVGEVRVELFHDGRLEGVLEVAKPAPGARAGDLCFADWRHRGVNISLILFGVGHVGEKCQRGDAAL